jgi:hypothetical protein
MVRQHYGTFNLLSLEHDTPFDVERPQDFRNRRHLVRTGDDFDLPQRQMLRHDPGAHDFNRLLLVGFVVRAAQGFAIERDHLSIPELDLCINPLEQTAFELSRFKHAQNTREGVVRGDVIGQLQKLLQPFLFRIAKGPHLGRVFGSTDHRAQADDDDVDQPMSFIAVNGESGKSERQLISVATEISRDIGDYSSGPDFLANYRFHHPLTINCFHNAMAMYFSI